jgi:hypothetical protein
MVKDNKRFADSGGWGWAVFDYDAASDTFRPGTLADKPPQGKRRQVRVRVPHEREDKRLRFHGLRAQVKRYEQHTDEQMTTQLESRALGWSK